MFPIPYDLAVKWFIGGLLESIMHGPGGGPRVYRRAGAVVKSVARWCRLLHLDRTQADPSTLGAPSPVPPRWHPQPPPVTARGQTPVAGGGAPTRQIRRRRRASKCGAAAGRGRAAALLSWPNRLDSRARRSSAMSRRRPTTAVPSRLNRSSTTWRRCRRLPYL